MRDVGWTRRICAVCLVIGLAATAGGCSFSRQDKAETIGRSGELMPRSILAGRWTLKAWTRMPAHPPERLRVYIEGDGDAFHFGRPTVNPTPKDPTALILAADDPAEAVAYIARPCMYVTVKEREATCTVSDWTDARYSQEAVSALSAAIDAVQPSPGTRIDLVGYSGGGVLAMLLAARRGDIASVSTFAAPLDLAAWVSLKAFSPLAASINPAKEADRVIDVPQRHFIGDEDDVVPPEVLRLYARSFPSGRRPEVIVLPDQDHSCCWRDVWRGWRDRRPALPAQD